MLEKIKKIYNQVKKVVSFAFYTALVVLCLSIPKLIEQAHVQFLYIHSSNNVFLITDPKGGRATAFRINVEGETFLVTNDHVCSYETYPEIKKEDSFLMLFGILKRPVPTKYYHKFLYINYGHAYPANVKVIKYDEKKDLCLLSDPFFNNPLPALQLGSNGPLLQDMVHIVGFPAFDEASLLIFESGRFQGVIKDNKEADRNVINGGILPGSSGSPVLNNFGEVIGVINRYYLANQYPIFISLQDLKEFLNVK